MSREARLRVLFPAHRYHSVSFFENTGWIVTLRSPGLFDKPFRLFKNEARWQRIFGL